mgnify:CR=1 FL=1
MRIGPVGSPNASKYTRTFCLARLAMDQQSPLDFNFWPSFSDSMLAIVFVMVLLFVLLLRGMGIKQEEQAAIQEKQEIIVEKADSLMDVTHTQRFQINRLRSRVAQQRQKIRRQTVEITEIRRRQDRIREQIARVAGARVEKVSTSRPDEGISSTPQYAVYDDTGRRMLSIYYDIQLQRLTFDGNVLFRSNRYQLSEKGETLLRAVGRAIDDEIGSIERIQIEGHTDDRPTSRYRGGNLELGALRAITVFRFFTQEPDIRINPDRHTMSVTSFGPHQPVASNRREATRAENRRIELLLFFKRGSDARVRPSSSRSASS